MKELESRLAERDAMIRVLQKKHSFEKDVSGSYPSICLSHHTPHSSLNTTDLTSDDLGKYNIIYNNTMVVYLMITTCIFCKFICTLLLLLFGLFTIDFTCGYIFIKCIIILIWYLPALC